MRAWSARGGLAVSLTIVAAACGGARHRALPDYYQPITAGRGPQYRLPALSPRAARGLPIDGLSCSGSRVRTYAIHLELFARRHVLPIPAGIGVAPPQRRSGVYVLSGSCSYQVATYEPTGLTIVKRSRPTPKLGQLFALWGQPLSADALASFRGRVLAYVAGRRWRGSPASIPLNRHAVIAVEVGGLVLPHPSYVFPPGL
jgi:hypothetical protein